MGRLEGKVAVVSGAARGQGRSHAVTLAREGASIVAFDACTGFETIDTPPADEGDLRETARLVEAHDRPCIAAKADARDLPAMRDLAERTIDELGSVDVLCVNHGIWNVAANSWEMDEAHFEESIDVMLTGTFKVVKAFAPKMIAGGRGGSVIITASANGMTPQPGAIAYCAAKAGQINMARVLAWELGPDRIRVNAICPGAVDTAMLQGGTVERVMELNPAYVNVSRNLLPVELQPAQSISDAVLWLASEEAAYVTGTTLSVDAGFTNY
jgi:(+)-trans-carveol dehydrogenase